MRCSTARRAWPSASDCSRIDSVWHMGKHDELPWRDVVAIPSDEISSRPAKSQ